MGVKSSAATERYVMRRINTIEMFKAFPVAGRRGATLGLWLFSHCSVKVGDGSGFQAEVYLHTDRNCMGEDKRAER